MATALDPFYYFHPTDRVSTTTVTAGASATEDTAYPLTNAVDFTYANIANPSKLNEVTGAWVFDQTSATRVDFVVLWGNVKAGLVIDVQMHATDSWGAPTVNGHITMPAKRANGYAVKVFIDLRSVSGYTTSGLRYLRVNVAGVNDAALGLKALLYSRVRQLDRDFQWGVVDTEHQIAVTMKTDAGVRWSYDLTSAPRVLAGSAFLSDADADLVREWHRACAGVVGLTTVIKEPTVNDAWVGYWSPGGFSIEAPSLMVSEHATTRPFTDANATSLAIEEVTAGDPEWY